MPPPLKKFSAQGAKKVDYGTDKKSYLKEREVPQTRPPLPLGPAEPVTVSGPAGLAEANRSPNISEVRIRVPKEDHRYIVGLRQKNLKEIYNLTGVTIDVPGIYDDSEEVIVRGDKFQIGPAITLMYTKVTDIIW